MRWTRYDVRYDVPRLYGLWRCEMVTAIVPAAGASRRLGEPKQLVRLGGERLLERTVRVAREAGLRVVVVLGCEAETIRAACDLCGADVVVNEAWAEGMGSSIRCGVEAAGECTDGVAVLTCDQPAVTPEHLRRLVAEGRDGDVAASGYGGRTGVPAYFPAGNLHRLRELSGDAGARALLAGCRMVPLPDGELDVDTIEALQKARTRWEGAH